MSLNSVGAAHHQHCVIHDPERPLHLRRKVHMSRRINERNLRLSQREYRLLGKNRDSPAPLQRKIIKKRIAVIHPSQLPQASGQI